MRNGRPNLFSNQLISPTPLNARGLAGMRISPLLDNPNLYVTCRSPVPIVGGNEAENRQGR